MNYPPYYQPSYQPYAPPMMDQLAQLRAQQPAPNPMIWVQGEAAAKSYLVAAENISGQAINVANANMIVERVA